MTPLALYLSLSLAHLCAGSCKLDRHPDRWEQKLYEDLYVNYTWSEKINKKVVTDVRLWIMLEKYELNSDDLFSIHTWLDLRWIDQDLRWNSSEYGGLADNMFTMSTYWAPRIVLNNRIYDMSLRGTCKSDQNGNVQCVAFQVLQTQCYTNLRNWPYDVQTCKLNYGIAKKQKNVRLIGVKDRGLLITGEESYQWRIVYREQKENTIETQLNITLLFERLGDPLAAIIIVPSILLSVMMTAFIILDVNDHNRLPLMVFGLMCNFFFLSQIPYDIPKHSVETPLILLFYRFSLIFNCFLVVLTLLLFRLRNRSTPAPPWLRAANSAVVTSYGRYLLWPRWEINRELMVSDSVDTEDLKAWNGAANIINSACLYVSILVHIILMSVLIPRPEGLKSNLRYRY